VLRALAAIIDRALRASFDPAERSSPALHKSLSAEIDRIFDAAFVADVAPPWTELSGLLAELRGRLDELPDEVRQEWNRYWTSHMLVFRARERGELNVGLAIVKKIDDAMSALGQRIAQREYDRRIAAEGAGPCDCALLVELAIHRRPRAPLTSVHSDDYGGLSETIHRCGACGRLWLEATMDTESQHSVSWEPAREDD
jgi:hypothetical protein